MNCLSCLPSRAVLGLLLLWSSMSAFLLRVNINLAIVTMAKLRPQDNGTSECVNVTSSNKADFGEFDWSETTQGVILSAFFWGYLVLQLPGGRLAEVVGGRRVLGTALLLASLLSAATPVLTRLHYGFLIAVRAGQGLCLGVHFPCMSAMVTRWVPLDERSTFISLCTFGGSLGLAVMMPLCGLVISWLGWDLLFYLSAAQGLLFTLCWFLLVHDSPEQHPRISLEEKTYIAEGLVRGPVRLLPVPWRSLLTSLQVWAPFLTAVGSDWGFYLLLTMGPKYMASILGVNIKHNGMLSALPFLCRYIFGAIVARAVDMTLRRELLTLTCLRRIAVCISHLLPAVALGMFPLIECSVTYSVVLLCVAMACNGAISSGHVQSYMDIAPNFAGTLAGLRNGLSSVTGIISPIVLGILLEDQASMRVWHLAFLLSAVIYATSSVLYLACFSARVQDWNDQSFSHSQESRGRRRPTWAENIRDPNDDLGLAQSGISSSFISDILE